MKPTDRQVTLPSGSRFSWLDPFWREVVIQDTSIQVAYAIHIEIWQTNFLRKVVDTLWAFNFAFNAVDNLLIKQGAVFYFRIQAFKLLKALHDAFVFHQSVRCIKNKLAEEHRLIELILSH